MRSSLELSDALMAERGNLPLQSQFGSSEHIVGSFGAASRVDR